MEVKSEKESILAALELIAHRYPGNGIVHNIHDHYSFNIDPDSENKHHNHYDNSYHQFHNSGDDKINYRNHRELVGQTRQTAIRRTDGFSNEQGHFLF
jgi:hypothetical protein